MVRVSGSLRLVTDRPALVSQVRVRAARDRAENGGLTTTFDDVVPVRNGRVEMDVLPGPAVMLLEESGGFSHVVKLLVPDHDASLEECVKAAGEADVHTRRELEEWVWEIRDSQPVFEAIALRAVGAAGAARTSEQRAKQSEQNAKTSETNAGKSATAAGTSETNAGKAARDAQSSATAAATSETNSAEHASKAARHEVAAQGHAGDAEASAESAKSDADRAETAREESAESAAAAHTSNENAKASAEAAAVSEKEAKRHSYDAGALAAHVETLMDDSHFDGDVLVFHGKRSIPLTGKPGDTPTIGDNGNWWIGGEDTGKPAQGEPGTAPTGGWTWDDLDNKIKADFDALAEKITTAGGGSVSASDITFFKPPAGYGEDVPINDGQAMIDFFTEHGIEINEENVMTGTLAAMFLKNGTGNPVVSLAWSLAEVAVMLDELMSTNESGGLLKRLLRQNVGITPPAADDPDALYAGKPDYVLSRIGGDNWLFTYMNWFSGDPWHLESVEAVMQRLFGLDDEDIDSAFNESEERKFSIIGQVELLPFKPVPDRHYAAGMFAGLSNLRALPTIDMSGVTNARSMFAGCTSLKDGMVKLINREPGVDTTDMIKDSGLTREPWYDADGNPID